MKRIGVIMTVFNRKEQTIKCLTCLYNQLRVTSDFTVDVYLTDDASTDGTEETIQNEFPSVNIIRGTGELYWNRGMYMAWKEAEKNDYDFYLWLNNDTYLYDDALDRLLETAERFDNHCIVVGSTCSPDDKNVITYGGYSNGKMITDLRRLSECDAINGNIVLISRSVFRILGTNDPYYRHACGDTDYGLRAKEKGITCVAGIGVFGVCASHEFITCWKDPEQPFGKRLKNFLSPLGDNPFEFFYFKRKHYGFPCACICFISNWLHFFFPGLWIRMRSKQK